MSKSKPPDISKLFSYLGEKYAFDVEAFNKLITIVNTKDDKNVKEVHIAKYEMYKALIEVVISPVDDGNEEKDEIMRRIKPSMNAPFDFTVAFNTLLKDGIIIVYE